MPAYLNEEQFGLSLALMGQNEPAEYVKVLFNKYVDGAGVLRHGFFAALSSLRQRVNDNDEALEAAFDDLYQGTCFDDMQKDATGNKYIWARDFRNLLTSMGEDPLTDEEADELIRECHPIYDTSEGNEGAHRASLMGKIYFEQYRAMLLDRDPKPSTKRY
jgi:Ca2+-binding EF-hand superfamily protein